MKSLLKRLWKRRQRPASSSTSGQTKGDNADTNMDMPVMKVLGSRIIPRSLVDTAHLSILNHCTGRWGRCFDYLEARATPPAMEQTGKRECTRRAGPRDFVLKSRSRLQVNIRSLEEQEITLSKPLDIKKGQYVGLTNRSGRLSVTYTRGWTTETSATGTFGTYGTKRYNQALR